MVAGVIEKRVTRMAGETRARKRIGGLPNFCYHEAV